MATHRGYADQSTPHRAVDRQVPERPPDGPVVEVSELRKEYGTHVAVRDVSFTVRPGEIFGILGPNGAGKTTTVECIEGLREPDAGSIRVLGLDPLRDRARLRHLLGAQLQESALPEKLKLREALELYSSFYRKPADGESLIEELGLADKRDTAFRKLSGGQKQRLSIALALIGNPRVAVLDELTTGLDPRARRDTWQLIERIRDRGVTILLVTHFMEEAERLCDRLAIIHAGRVVAVDSPAGLIARVGSGQSISFRPSVPFDDATLTSIPGVTGLRGSGPEVTVTGTGNLLYEVSSALAAAGVVPADLRVRQASLDDAFVALTGRRLDD